MPGKVWVQKRHPSPAMRVCQGRKKNKIKFAFPALLCLDSSGQCFPHCTCVTSKKKQILPTQEAGPAEENVRRVTYPLFLLTREYYPPCRNRYVSLVLFCVPSCTAHIFVRWFIFLLAKINFLVVYRFFFRQLRIFVLMDQTSTSWRYKYAQITPAIAQRR